MKKATQDTILQLREAFKDAEKGRFVLVVGHTAEYAEGLAASVRQRLIMTKGLPQLVTSCGRLGIPKKIRPGTAIHIHRNVIEVGIEGQAERYGPRAFLRCWRSFAGDFKDAVDENPDSVGAEDDKAHLPRAEETETDDKGDDG